MFVSLKHLSHLFCFIIMFTHCLSSDDLKRFVVVSDFTLAELMYPAAVRSAHEPTERRIEEVDVKKQTCEDVTSSYLFAAYEKYRPSEEDVDRRSSVEDRANFPTETVKISLRSGGAEKDEIVFVCLIKRGEQVSELYISEEYNLSDGVVDSNTRPLHIPARFIFRAGTIARWVDMTEENVASTRILFGIAQLPAQVFFSPDYDIEFLFLKIRERKRIPSNPEEDALARLPPPRQRQICLSVFGSFYFQGKIRRAPIGDIIFIPDMKRETVLFQTERGMAEAEGPVEEWMLPCQFDHSVRGPEYLLSHADEPDQVFIFLRDRGTGEIFVENLATNVPVVLRSDLQKPAASEDSVDRGKPDTKSSAKRRKRIPPWILHQQKASTSR